MHKRRDIRETAVQFLYFADLEGGANPSAMQDTFWHITQENSLRKLATAKAKAILHIAQGRDARVAKLSERIPLSLAELKAAGNPTALTVPLRRLLRQESKLNAALELLRSATQSNSGDSLIESRLDDVFVANHVMADARNSWDDALVDFPAWKTKLEPITATTQQLARISSRFDAIENLDAPTDQQPQGIDHLRASNRQIASFREQTEQLVQGVLEHKGELDEKLAAIVDNFSPERIDPVDRAILRIGAYEITHCDDIPRAVSINEAIEIAKRFGTSESARFVNGVLDSI